jgi:phospholipase/carboxylesterase
MTLPTLSGPSRPALSGNTKQLIILLHGLGADGNDLFGLSDDLAKALPDAAFASPNAPFACDMAPWGFQWFSLRDWSEASMLQGVRDAAPILNAFIDEQKAKYNLQDNQIALLGFSQGTMMSLHVALRRAEPLAGVVGFSGAMVAPQNLEKELTAKTPICLIHGMVDPVVPFMAMGMAEAALKAANVPVETHARPMLPHSIDGEGISAAIVFLKRVLS